jgi:hypothetical protein
MEGTTASWKTLSEKRQVIPAPTKKDIFRICTLHDQMPVTKYIPVSEETYKQILDLGRPNETVDATLARMVEKVKKQRLADDVEEIMARNDFVELKL